MADIKKKLVDGAGLQAAMGIMADYADKGVRGAIGGYNQSFPLTAATKGNIYYHKGTNRYYICVDNYNGSSLTNPNSKFEELSVYTNRQRLDNLHKLELETVTNLIDVSRGIITTSHNFKNGEIICVETGQSNTGQTYNLHIMSTRYNIFHLCGYNALGHYIIKVIGTNKFEVIKCPGNVRGIYRVKIK